MLFKERDHGSRGFSWCRGVSVVEESTRTKEVDVLPVNLKRQRLGELQTCWFPCNQEGRGVQQATTNSIGACTEREEVISVTITDPSLSGSSTEAFTHHSCSSVSSDITALGIAYLQRSTGN